ncbi:MAG: type II toxin-antitoxin system PemK/MazF family toxin [Deltaproteobacteria bacterium]|nr:type II toxin-antitoxin system PemK/MazF family toxin [Deltaproteobacteria bacterium]
MPRTLRRGDVVLVAFPFTDLTATKVRPAIVVSPDRAHRFTADVLLAAVSSVIPRRSLLPSELLVSDRNPGFGATGLKCSSVILCGKLFTMEQRLVLRWLGRLDAALVARLDQAVGAAVGLSPWK